MPSADPARGMNQMVGTRGGKIRRKTELTRKDFTAACCPEGTPTVDLACYGVRVPRNNVDGVTAFWGSVGCLARVSVKEKSPAFGGALFVYRPSSRYLIRIIFPVWSKLSVSDHRSRRQSGHRFLPHSNRIWN